MFTPDNNHLGHDSMMSLSPSSPGGHNLSIGQGHNTSGATHSGAHTGSVSSPFLPGFLLGDHLSHHQTMSSPRLWSSGGSHSPSHKSQAHSTPTCLSRRDSTRKIGAPPVKSLYSTPSLDGAGREGGFPLHSGGTVSSPSLRTMGSPAPPTSGLFHTPGTSRADTSLQSLPHTLPVSPAQADPFYTQGDLKSDDQLDGTWVTVFGFPPGATSFILQQFAQYGTILKHVVATECNWMHIHYLNKIQAKKALSKDGKIYGGCMRIGVTPCIEKTIMEEKENSGRPSLLSESLSSPAEPHCGRVTSLTPIRPLTAAYVASRGEYEVLKDKNTPQKDTGVMAKLKDYMFG